MTQQTKPKSGVFKTLTIYFVGIIGWIIIGVIAFAFLSLVLMGVLNGLSDLWNQLLILLPVALVIEIIWIIVRSIKNNNEGRD